MDNKRVEELLRECSRQGSGNVSLPGDELEELLLVYKNWDPGPLDCTCDCHVILSPELQVYPEEHRDCRECDRRWTPVEPPSVVGSASPPLKTDPRKRTCPKHGTNLYPGEVCANCLLELEDYH